MAHVVTGKIDIPGENLSEYLHVLEETEKATAPFRKQLEQLNREFERSLETKFSKKTARKHALVIEVFIDFVCWQTDVRSIDELTRAWPTVIFADGIAGKPGKAPRASSKQRSRSSFSFSTQRKVSRTRPCSRVFSDSDIKNAQMVPITGIMRG